MTATTLATSSSKSSKPKPSYFWASSAKTTAPTISTLIGATFSTWLQELATHLLLEKIHSNFTTSNLKTEISKSLESISPRGPLANLSTISRCMANTAPIQVWPPPIMTLKAWIYGKMAKDCSSVHPISGRKILICSSLDKLSPLTNSFASWSPNPTTLLKTANISMSTLKLDNLSPTTFLALILSGLLSFRWRCPLWLAIWRLTTSVIAI